MDITEKLFWIGHASFYVKHNGKNIFIDPFNVSDKIGEKADLVIITHAHGDHYSVKDINKVMKPNAELVFPNNCIDGDAFKNPRIIAPGESFDYNGVKISAVPAYNNKKEKINFHPKANKWVGYVIDVDGFSIYHAGDTDFIDEMKTMKDIGASLLPIGGTYVMNVDEGIDAANAIKAQYSIPMHYKALLGREGSAAAEQKWKSKAINPYLMKEMQEPMFKFGGPG